MILNHAPLVSNVILNDAACTHHTGLTHPVPDLLCALSRRPRVSRMPAKEALMQFGKQRHKTFALDFRHPISALQAFGIALSAFGFREKPERRRKGKGT